jgi:hypothetical protein
MSAMLAELAICLCPNIIKFGTIGGILRISISCNENTLCVLSADEQVILYGSSIHSYNNYNI